MFKGSGEQFPSGGSNENSNPNPNQGQKSSLFEENKRLAEQIAADRARRSGASSPNQSFNKADAKISPEVAKRLDQRIKQNSAVKKSINGKADKSINLLQYLSTNGADRWEE